jgi:hypothetical protein
MCRAKELLRLFEKREAFRQMGTTGLGRAKREVEEVRERFARRSMAEREGELRWHGSPD